jgi:NAD(P)-dependent dehydrogenase (short-subunit alcohol dehydrogenase family)
VPLGGGSGIGEALAHRFLDVGNRIFVAGRRREALEAAIGVRDGMFALENRRAGPGLDRGGGAAGDRRALSDSSRGLTGSNFVTT